MKRARSAKVERTGLEQFLDLVINREGCLNPHLVTGICEKFVRTTYMQSCFLMDVDSGSKGRLEPCG